ncbi:MAG: flagellar biosynthetic protein FliO [Deltaproteobacteria bacterium]|nr:flagellar biosynthetic protein FliO [Deltaproteobacteria bacterium]MBW2024180.1 flagellar biosynthetic protein FliO [Deltaproteobacteria bacterium]MBW2125795.1 flagellar biosynthetic protein FliO [Deltaproteobacteria bacterium]RLB20393.1 MAG: flagellar biosynthetic protein FliO [Deltaproteobacteria bacterium]
MRPLYLILKTEAIVVITSLTTWLLFRLPEIVFAAEGPPGPSSSPTTDMTMATIKMLASLILIIGLILCVFYFLKRFRGIGRMAVSGPQIRLVGSLSLAPKRSVAVVEVEGQWLVLGVGTENITLLSTLEPEKRNARDIATDPQTVGGFKALFQRKKALFQGEKHREDN